MTKKYEVRKISCGVRNSDNSRMYDNCLEFGTFKEMKEELIKSNSNIFTGQGSDIFMNGNKIAHSYDWAMMENQAKEGLLNISLKNLIAEAEYNK